MCLIFRKEGGGYKVHSCTIFLCCLDGEMMIHTEIQRIWITRIVELGNYLGGTVPPKSAKLFLPKIFSVKRGWGYPPIPQKKHRQNNSFLQEHVFCPFCRQISQADKFSPRGERGGVINNLTVTFAFNLAIDSQNGWLHWFGYETTSDCTWHKEFLF